MLAGAYALAGKGQTAGAVLEGIGKKFPEYTDYDITYGSSFRDKMVALDALVLCGRVSDALSIAAEDVPSQLSTQESAFASVAYRHLYEQVPTSVIKATVGGQELVSSKSVVSAPVPADATVTSGSEGKLYGTLVSVSRDPVTAAVSNGLKLEVKYLDEVGALLLPASYGVKQGTRFSATIRVDNVSGRELQNLALSIPIPSGWEIVNDRLTTGASDESGYDHKDIRDDRVNWFFALPAGRYKTFTVQLRAAYEGRYTLPAVVCEAMYNPAVNAAVPGGQTTVSR